MSALDLCNSGDCDPYTCPVCAHYDAQPQTVVELIEAATGRNGHALLASLRGVGLDVIRAGWGR